MNKFLYTAVPLTMLSLAAKAEEAKPNILWIVTDDQRADALACWNRAVSGKSESALGYVSSPNIDKLAEEGVLFTRSFCNSPLSGPSRGSMHTGKYPHRYGGFNFQMKHNEHDAANPALPEVMREVGYQTSSFGKLGCYIYTYNKPMKFQANPAHYELIVSEREIEKAGVGDFTEPWVSNDKPYDKIVQWHYDDGTPSTVLKLYSKKKAANEPAEDKAAREAFYKKQGMIIPGKNPLAASLAGFSTKPTDETEDGRIREVFSEYIKNPGKQYYSVAKKKVMGPDTSKPQFINLGFHFPHTPVMPSKEYYDKFKDKKYTLPAYNPAETEMLPKQLQTWHRNFNFYDFTKDEQQRMVQDYYAFCAMGDELIGRTVAEFKEYCKKNDRPYVIVFACGDHGWHLGEQGAYFKWSNFLKSNETAIIAVSSDKKRFPAGKVVHDFAEYVDFAPTFFAAAGIDVTQERFDYLDGRDLSLTANEKIAPRDYVLGEVNVYGNRAFIRGKEFSFSMKSRPGNGIATLKNMPNSNIKWAMECAPEEAEMALYDLRVDPEERYNLAYDSKYAELTAWFRNKLGNIVLGDGRLEVVWGEKNVYDVSNFAKGADDKKLDIPKSIIPEVKVPKGKDKKKR